MHAQVQIHAHTRTHTRTNIIVAALTMQFIVYAEWAFVALLLAAATVFTLWMECKGCAVRRAVILF